MLREVGPLSLGRLLCYYKLPKHHRHLGVRTVQKVLTKLAYGTGKTRLINANEKKMLGRRHQCHGRNMAQTARVSFIAHSNKYVRFAADELQHRYWLRLIEGICELQLKNQMAVLKHQFHLNDDCVGGAIVGREISHSGRFFMISGGLCVKRIFEIVRFATDDTPELPKTWERFSTQQLRVGGRLIEEYGIVFPVLVAEKKQQGKEDRKTLL